VNEYFKDGTIDTEDLQKLPYDLKEDTENYTEEYGEWVWVYEKEWKEFLEKWETPDSMHETPDEWDFQRQYNTERFSDRDYRLFALLADVRNYRSDIIPISHAKGLPFDVSKEVKQFSDSW
jgi:hypothetical protein